MNERTPQQEYFLKEISFPDATTANVDLSYPRTDGAINTVEVSLVDVRAADSIKISYDFERDGWKIEQASKFRWEPGDQVCDPGWAEVSFIQAWQREEGGTP